MRSTTKGGGGGALAWSTLAQHPGDSRFLSLSTVNMLANHIMGVGTAHHRDFTPLGHLIHGYIGFAVKSDSAIRSGQDLLSRLKQDPGSLSISIGTSPGNASHVALLQATRPAGIESRNLKTVVFKPNGESLTALLGGHVDVAVSGLSNLVKHAEAGTVRLIALTAPTRVPGILAGVPTWREQGADVTVSGFRGALGPAKMPPAQIAFWEDAIGKLVDSAEWEQVLVKEYAMRTRVSAAECSCTGALSLCAGCAMIAACSLACGASTPWKRMRCSRGRGTSAASRCMNSSADITMWSCRRDRRSSTAARLGLWHCGSSVRWRSRGG